LFTFHRCSTLFREAYRILDGSEYHPGAPLRSAFCLSLVLMESGAIKEATALRAEVQDRLNRIKDLTMPESSKWSPASFERFVLFCHR
jgi:hypothetical protein